MASKKTTAKRSSKWKPGQSGNPAGRPKGIPNASTRLRKLIDVEGIIETLQAKALDGNTRAAELLLERALPPLRQVAEAVELPGLKKADTLTDKAKLVVDLAAAGQISPDVATSLVHAITQMARVAEIDELDRRLAALEEASEKNT